MAMRTANLSADEFAASLTGGAQLPEAPRRGAAQQPAQSRPGRPGKATRPEPGHILAALDADGDGKLTLDEIPEKRKPRLKKLITRADKDGDGALSLVELRRAMRVQMASTAQVEVGTEVRPASQAKSSPVRPPDNKKGKSLDAGKKKKRSMES
jgi:hypothetical protein